MVFLASFVLFWQFKSAVMDLYSCPLAFLWFYSQFAILLQTHFGSLLLLSQNLSVSYWFACHTISHYMQHECIIYLHSITKRGIGKTTYFLSWFQVFSILCPFDDSHLPSIPDLTKHFDRSALFKTQMFILAHCRNRNLILRTGKTNHITELIRRTASCTAGQTC